jgi:hypothetical protein
LGLNRAELIERREERIKSLRDLLDKVARTADVGLQALVRGEVQKELEHGKEYMMIARGAYAALC